jgi:hypothetical protein
LLNDPGDGIDEAAMEIIMGAVSKEAAVTGTANVGDAEVEVEVEGDDTIHPNREGRLCKDCHNASQQARMA